MAATGAATCAAVECATVWVVTFAGARGAAVMRVACRTGRAVAVDVAVLLVVVVVSVAVGAGLVSVTGGAVVLVSVVGVVVSGGVCVLAAGEVSGGTGCACWARTGVEESARAAAIAGTALVRL